jgi:hypothetical protein
MIQTTGERKNKRSSQLFPHHKRTKNNNQANEVSAASGGDSGGHVELS